MGKSIGEGFRLHPAPSPLIAAPFRGLMDFTLTHEGTHTHRSKLPGYRCKRWSCDTYEDRSDGETLQALEVGSRYLGKNSVAGVSL